MSQHKDLSLTTWMISLGSDTMKLNFVVYFAICSWPDVMNIYSFDPASNTIDYRRSPTSLEAYPCKTGFDACSLQPTNGVSGEYAGLLMIRKYLESIRQETEDTRRTEHMRSRMDLLYRRSLQFAIRSTVMTTSDCWVI